MVLRIDVATGGTVLDAADLRQPGLIPFVLGRRYESARPETGAFGTGWRSGFEVALEVTDKEVIVRGGFLDGIAFAAVAPGKEARLEDSGVTLQHHAEAYILFNSRNRQWVFPSTGRAGVVRPSAVRDAGGNALRFDHRNARLTAVTDPDGRRFQFTWSSDRLATVHRESGGRTQVVRAYEYNARGDLIRVVDALGASSRYAYDGGLMVSVEHPDGGRQYASYDEYKRCAGLWDDAGNVFHVLHDPPRMTTRVWDREGAQTLYRHAAGKAVMERIAPAGASQGFYYDEGSRLVGYSDDDGTTQLFERLDPGSQEMILLDGTRRPAFIQYDEGGQALRLMDAAERETTVVRDAAAGEIMALTDALGAKWTFQRERAGRVTGISSPEGRQLSIRWARGQRQVEGAAGVVRRDSLDDSGRLTLTTDALGRERRFAYDAEGRLTGAGSGGYGIEFIYGHGGHLIGTVDTERRRYRLATDFLGRASDAEVDGRRLIVRYDPTGRLLGVAEGESRRAIARYDALGRLTRIDGPAGPVVTYTRDDDGSVIAQSAGAKLRFNAGGDPVELDLGARRDHLTYGSSGELLALEREGEEPITTIFDYDACARVSKVSWFPNEEAPHLASLVYDLDGLLSELRIDDAAFEVGRSPMGTPTAFRAVGNEVACTTDAAGRLTELTGEDASITLQYDDLDRLRGAIVKGQEQGERTIDLRQNGSEFVETVASGLVLAGTAQGVLIGAEVDGAVWPLWVHQEFRAEALDFTRASVIARLAGWRAVLRPPVVHGESARARWLGRRWDDHPLAVPSSRDVGLDWPGLNAELLDPRILDAHAADVPGAVPSHQHDQRSPYDLISGQHRCRPLRSGLWSRRSIASLLTPAGVPNPHGFDLTAALALLLR